MGVGLRTRSLTGQTIMSNTVVILGSSGQIKSGANSPPRGGRTLLWRGFLAEPPRGTPRFQPGTRPPAMHASTAPAWPNRFATRRKHGRHGGVESRRNGEWERLEESTASNPPHLGNATLALGRLKKRPVRQAGRPPHPLPRALLSIYRTSIHPNSGRFKNYPAVGCYKNMFSRLQSIPSRWFCAGSQPIALEC